ncbi:hypothetical protein BDZ94DRAFT_1259607 [Collybia nuda]|uniref:Uncharacterized protein n=1 Tax=Collybia nuda TaxID=64659 RepID=A0A9P5Y5K4_9AGAR|nr:hypothetical protein BDZ94DRAFT_1259607 [Collybia nuda]
MMVREEGYSYSWLLSTKAWRADLSITLSLSTRWLNIRDDGTLSPSVIRSPVSLRSSGTIPSPSLDSALVRPFVSL